MWGLACTVKGRFTDFSGDGEITATANGVRPDRHQAASLRTGIRKRDEHLRSADFFDAEKFPDISVAVTGADATGGDSLDLHGTLTVRAATRPLALPDEGDAPSATAGCGSPHRPPSTARSSASTATWSG